MLPVTFEDVKAALPRVRAVLQPTSLINWPGLSQPLGCDLHIKHENHQPVGAFKVRGGVNLVSTLTEQERASGIWGVSTGNHGQSLAFAAGRVNCRCTIVVPEKGNADKYRAMRQLGAEVIEGGHDFEAARIHLEQLLATRGGRYVHSANEPLLIAGVGTMAWEIFEQLPEPDVILVPIGLGSGVSGTCLVAKHLRPATRVIGVQAANASAVARSWASGKMEADECVETWAEGMATRVAADMTLAIMRELMDDVILVSEDEMRVASFQLLKQTHNLAEGAGAATLAAVTQQRDRFRGQRVVAVLSGGNLDLAELPRILALGDKT